MHALFQNNTKSLGNILLVIIPDMPARYVSKIFLMFYDIYVNE